MPGEVRMQGRRGRASRAGSSVGGAAAGPCPVRAAASGSGRRADGQPGISPARRVPSRLDNAADSVRTRNAPADRFPPVSATAASVGAWSGWDVTSSWPRPGA